MWLEDFKKSSGLLGACGVDNRELESAIATAEKAMDNLKRCRELTVARFKAEGVHHASWERQIPVASSLLI